MFNFDYLHKNLKLVRVFLVDGEIFAEIIYSYNIPILIQYPEL